MRGTPFVSVAAGALILHWDSGGLGATIRSSIHVYPHRYLVYLCEDNIKSYHTWALI
jgi:hypothetical protein